MSKKGSQVRGIARVMTTSNYFVVPAARRPKSRMTESTTDPRAGRTIAIGEARFLVVSRFEVTARTKVLKDGDRAILPLGALQYYRAKAELNGEFATDVVLRFEKVGKDEDARITWVLVERDSEEWISIKVAKILETPSAPGDIDWARYFFFDGRDPASTAKAFEAARMLSSSIAAYRTIPIPGPWSTACLLGSSLPEAN